MVLLGPLLGLLILVPIARAAVDSAYPLQQKLFLVAEQALKNRQQEQFEKLRDALKGYPLLPYLDYRALLQKLDQASAEEVADFLQRNRETPLAHRLRVRWLNLLAERGDWNTYLRFYQDDGNVVRQCHHLRALIEIGRKEAAFARVEPIWLHGRSRPKACDPVFQAWREADGLTPELVWQRIALAMDLGQVRLVRYLQKLLPKKERPQVELWLKLRKKPELALEEKRLQRPHAMRQAMLEYAVIRKSRSNPLAALDLWQKLQDKGLLPPGSKKVESALARRLLRNESAEAWSFFLRLPSADTDAGLQEQRILAALYRQRWEQVLDWISRLPPERRSQSRWRYWKARSLEMLGERGSAEPIFQELARERGYYGFLAADHVGAPYHLEHQPTPVDQELLDRVAGEPAIQRARELVSLERWTDARREWRLITRKLDDEAMMAAAKLAQSWDWHDQAIFTLARTGYWDDLELRFPLEHLETVVKRAEERNLDVSWVFGVIRQESAFNPAVRSAAGAYGLMQLMPATARYVARKLLKQKRSPSRRDLTRPEVNIQLGTTYLSDVLARLEQNPVLATAAYNAGPHRVSRWLPREQLPADLWIELIPFKETRKYVKRVFTYAVIYDHRRKEAIVRLSQRLQPISGDSPQRTAQKRRNARATL